MTSATTNEIDYIEIIIESKYVEWLLLENAGHKSNPIKTWVWVHENLRGYNFKEFMYCTIFSPLIFN